MILSIVGHGVITAETSKHSSCNWRAEFLCPGSAVEKWKRFTTAGKQRTDVGLSKAPAARRSYIGVSKYLGFEGVRNPLEADCDTASARGKRISSELGADSLARKLRVYDQAYRGKLRQ